MSTLLKNIFISLFICHFIVSVYVLSYPFLHSQFPFFQNSPLLFISIALFYDFIISPLLQTLILGRLYGFKSKFIHFLSFVLIFISIPISWYVFFAFIKLFTGKSGSTINLLSVLGMFLVTYFIQTLLFFVFIKPNKDDSHQRPLH